MSLATNCPHCDRAYTLADTTLGKSVKCKDCGEAFVVQPSAPQPKPAAPKKAKLDPPEEDEVQPRREAKAGKRPARPRKKGGSSIGLLLLLGGVVLLLLLCAGGGGALYVSGVLGTKISGGDGGGLSILKPQKKPAIVILNDAADVFDSIKDQPSLDAAQPKLHDLGERLQPVKPVLATAIFLSKEAPGVPPEVAAQLAANVEKDPKFQPYLADGKALLADPDFLPAYRRYNTALTLAGLRVPNSMQVVVKEFRIQF